MWAGFESCASPDDNGCNDSSVMPERSSMRGRLLHFSKFLRDKLRNRRGFGRRLRVRASTLFVCLSPPRLNPAMTRACRTVHDVEITTWEMLERSRIFCSAYQYRSRRVGRGYSAARTPESSGS